MRKADPTRADALKRKADEQQQASRLNVGPTARDVKRAKKRAEHLQRRERLDAIRAEAIEMYKADIAKLKSQDDLYDWCWMTYEPQRLTRLARVDEAITTDDARKKKAASKRA